MVPQFQLPISKFLHQKNKKNYYFFDNCRYKLNISFRDLKIILLPYLWDWPTYKNGITVKLSDFDIFRKKKFKIYKKKCVLQG